MSRIRTSLVAIIAMGLLLMSVGVARADNLQQTDLVATPVTTTGAVGEFDVSYRLHVNNGDKGDQQPGCNAEDGSAAVATIIVPQHVTASPPTLTFTACDVVKTVHLIVDAPGDYDISASVADSGGGGYNESPARFSLHVVAPEPVDEPPVIDIPNDITYQTANATGDSVDFNVTASDNEDGDISDKVVCTPASGSLFPVGTTTVNCEVTDSAGHKVTESFKITFELVTPVDQEPVITASDIGPIEATGPTTPVTFNATASDDEDGNLTPSITYSPSGPFTVGVHNVTASVTDSANHTVSKTFKVTIVDTTPPELPDLSDINDVEATGPAGAVATFGPAKAHDLVDGDVDVVFTPLSGTTFALGETDVYYTAQDTAGNIAENMSFKVKVVDTTPPELSQLPDIAKDATSAAGAVVNYDPATAVDLVDGPVNVTYSKPFGDTFPLGITTVTYSATDAHNNPVTKSFKVKVTVPCANGLNPPINNDGSSVFKLGSTVPVKFNCFPGLTAKLNWAKVDSTPDGAVNEPASSNPANDGNLFRYDATAGQYIFNLGTKNLTAGTWTLHVTLGDGVDHPTNISLRK
jgi:hypothetical protein